jgi:hypothetical protein
MRRTILSKKNVIFIALFIFAITLFPEKSPSKSIKYAVLEGSPYNRGFYHGKTLKKYIIELTQKWKKYINRAFKIEADLYIKKFLEKTDFMPAIKKWAPELLEEIKGISDGSGIHFNTIYAFQLLDEIWVHGRDVLANHHCTSIGINRQGEKPTLAGPHPKRSGEHEVHPYLKPERLCRGESCIRLYYRFASFQAFSDRL